jgi:hypothetical protein
MVHLLCGLQYNENGSQFGAQTVRRGKPWPVRAMFRDRASPAGFCL